MVRLLLILTVVAAFVPGAGDGAVRQQLEEPIPDHHLDLPGGACDVGQVGGAFATRAVSAVVFVEVLRAPGWWRRRQKHTPAHEHERRDRRAPPAHHITPSLDSLSAPMAPSSPANRLTPTLPTTYTSQQQREKKPFTKKIYNPVTTLWSKKKKLNKSQKKNNFFFPFILEIFQPPDFKLSSCRD